jgi:hypothetical protein
LDGIVFFPIAWAYKFVTMEEQTRIARLQAIIQTSYSCKAAYRRTVRVQESLPDGLEWNGEVDVFWLTEHPGAKRCFAWQDATADSDVITVLEAPPVIGPATAVRAVLAGRQRRSSQ